MTIDEACAKVDAWTFETMPKLGLHEIALTLRIVVAASQEWREARRAMIVKALAGEPMEDEVTRLGKAECDLMDRLNR